MAAITPDTGTGATVVFGTTAPTAFFATMTDVSWTGISRAAFETSTIATTTAKTFKPGDLYDPGQLVIEMMFDTDNSPATHLSTTTAETITITWPDAETATCLGFLTDFEITGVNNDGLMKATGTVKLSGAITF